MIHLLLAVIYVSFISLGLPDSLLGAAWPSIYQGLRVPVSYSGVIFCIISVGTVISSLQSDRLTRKFGAGGVTAISVAMTAAALFGFSASNSFWALCLWAIPYGLGAGSVDTALNNYVALHFASRHMSWLHCMWGIGASVGPYIMGAALTRGAGWQMGYRIISGMQVVLTIMIVLSLPLWKAKTTADAGEQEAAPAKALTLKQIFRIPGVKEVLVTFFCYCSLEQTTSLWASSYLVLNRGISPETAASFASLFFLGITAGRALCGFLTLKLNDAQMVRMGLAGRLRLRTHLPQPDPWDAGPFRGGKFTGDHRGADGKRLHWQLPDAAAVRRGRKPYHHRHFSLLSAGGPDPDGGDARDAAKGNESGALKHYLCKTALAFFCGA